MLKSVNDQENLGCQKEKFFPRLMTASQFCFFASYYKATDRYDHAVV
jgi:hypothetical protein